MNKYGENILSTDEFIYTYADYQTWTENRRQEILNGVVFDMGPAPSTEHQRLFRRLFTIIANHLKGKSCEVFSAPFDVRLPASGETDDQTTTVVQPDIAVICDPGKIDKRGCRGAPDWIIEIVSPSSASHDLIRKLNLYEQHAVTEYWIVQPFYRIVMVYKMSDRKKYGPPVNFDSDRRIRPLAAPELEVDLGDLFD